MRMALLCLETRLGYFFLQMVVMPPKWGTTQGYFNSGISSDNTTPSPLQRRPQEKDQAGENWDMDSLPEIKRIVAHIWRHGHSGGQGH